MIRRILIANRGEIACRIAATASRMGIGTVAVYSDADRRARHVRSADAACRIGPAPAAESYLHVDRLLAALAESGADAVHPGYGFLAENAEFARAVTEAGAVFIGPPPEVMRRVGDKRAARRHMRAAGIPVVPGAEAIDSPQQLAAAAESLGYPLMVKAAAGGGGRGMRRVDTPEALAEAFATCRREALAAFGDGRLLVERCIEAARHVEVQVLAGTDGDGGDRVLHLFERDCSLQRRHQKVIEEAPAPERVEGLCQAAIAAAASVGYRGAGTVEFLVDPATGRFHFLEMNARLQVEHPVTEAITGLDLVEWQIRIAAGEPLSLQQHALRPDGHAIEARLCAEDPARDFLPSPGRLAALRLPAIRPGLRVDTGVGGGDSIPPDYDPLIAKVIAHGRDRAAARQLLAAALAECRVDGIATNVEFLRALVDSPEFRSGRVHTGLVAEQFAAGALAPPPAPAGVVAATALAASRAESERWRDRRRQFLRHDSPYSLADGWRLGEPAARVQALVSAAGHHLARLQPAAGGPVDPAGDAAWVASLAGREGAWRLRPLGPGRIRVQAEGGKPEEIRVEAGAPGSWWASLGPGRWLFRVPAPGGDSAARAAGSGDAFRAPLPGRVAGCHVEPGQRVGAGAALVTVEAMKTEHVLRAPVAGRVTEILARTGSTVRAGEQLLAFAADADEGSGSPGAERSGVEDRDG